MESSKAPRVFISYSWESEDHKNWVRYLGEKLYEAGIEACLDQWFVQPGESFTAFMEQEVAAADFVLVVCTPSYAHKSNNRQGGVGYEQQIVSGQLMSGTARSKFIPILRKGDYEPGPDFAIPTHFLGIAWIEFRDDAAFDKSLEDLIRVIFSKPRFAPPPLGIPPLLKIVSATLWKKDGGIDSENRFKELVQQGKNHYDRGAFEAAIADFNKAIELNPDFAEAYTNRGEAYYNQGNTFADNNDEDRANHNFSKAIADFSKAIEINPDGALAHNHRGQAYFAKGDRERAINDFSKAIEINPDFALAYYNRGNVYYGPGPGLNVSRVAKERAIAEFTKAIEINPDFALAYIRRGQTYIAKGYEWCAIDDFTKAIEINPDDALAYNHRGESYFAERSMERAINDFSKAIGLKPDFALAYYNRGEVYFAKRDKERAIDDLRKSLQLFPHSVSFYYRPKILARLKKLGVKER